VHVEDEKTKKKDVSARKSARDPRPQIEINLFSNSSLFTFTEAKILLKLRSSFMMHRYSKWSPLKPWQRRATFSATFGVRFFFLR